MRKPRPTVRYFDTPFLWRRVSPTEWFWEDGWSYGDTPSATSVRLIKCRRSVADERWDTGWYLVKPDGDEEYMGKTVSAAAQASAADVAVIHREQQAAREAADTWRMNHLEAKRARA